MDASGESGFEAQFKRHYEARYKGYAAMQEAAKKQDATGEADFYQAFYELEQLSQEILTEAALAEGYTPTYSTITVFFSRLGGKAMVWFGQESAVNWTKSMTPYINEMKVERESADTKYLPLFDYLIAQESIQYTAAVATEGGNWSAGEKVLREFIANYRTDR